MPRSTINNFTFEAYRELLLRFQKNHAYVTFAEFDHETTPNKCVILRHDIDYSLEQALRFAVIEAEHGIKATYFLLFSSPFYNLLDDENIDIARQINSLGHEVGLHYDVSVMLKAKAKHTLRLLTAQARLLAELSDAPVTSIAMHNPSVNGADIFQDSPFINAYDARFTKGMAYYSDSCMAWRNTFMNAFQADAFPARVQLLIHPILWSEEVLSRWEKLDRMGSRMQIEARQKLGVTRDIWRNHSGVREHDQREANALQLAAS